MVCTVIYYKDNSKSPQLKAFSSVEDAKEWIYPKDKQDKQYRSPISNAQIMVNYDVIDSYIEMFDLMKKGIFGTYNQNKVYIDKVEDDDR
jgi:hypothetical protein